MQREKKRTRAVSYLVDFKGERFPGMTLVDLRERERERERPNRGPG